MLDRDFGPALLGIFNHLFVISLPERIDRRREMAHQLKAIGLGFDDPRITLFPAIRMSEANGFPSSGTHGCFLSHLTVLREARARGLRNVLVAEDDLDFVPGGCQLAELLPALAQNPWHFFYGGYHFPERFVADGTGLVDVGANYSIGGAHLYAVSAAAYDPVIAYLEGALAAAAPRPHVDVAISDFRSRFPGCVTYVASPALGIQRRSRSDVQELPIYDRLKLLRPVANALRALAGRRRN